MTHTHVVTTRTWTDETTHIDVLCTEIDGRETWLATDDIGLIAMAYSRAGLDAALGKAVIPRGPRWAARSQPNDA
ncbi:MAG: hypothetical protein QOF57_2285 [Frankiaceae bacterium]|jgi:hypothetical protein|nr:hypothetical protein [Frankiaceae bacterium]